ncbi:chemotaxis protein CheX [Natronospora cellulosivora (SeqCode)]
MGISKEIIQACENTLPTFAFSISFVSETREMTLNSSEEVNILIGLSNGLQGNVVISFSRKAALKIISAMMGGMEVGEIDNIGESALGEMVNILMGSAIALLPDNIIELSPPTIVQGSDIYLMISNIAAQKMEFKIDEESFFIRYAIQ